MKKLFITLLIMSSFLWGIESAAQTLVFHLTDGTTTDVELSSAFRMLTVSGKLIVSLPDGSMKEFSQNDILTVTYRETRGDVNRDNKVDVADIATIISIMANGQIPPKAITVTTGSPSNVTYNSAVLEGTIKNVDSPVNVGVIYGKSSTLSIDNDKKATTTSKGDFTVTLSALDTSTTYYYCAFAEVNGKYYYGEMKDFKTEAAPVSITITTKDATDVKETSATLNGSITASNTTKSYTTGFFVATSGTPSSSNYTKKVESGSNKTGSYSSSVSGLSANTTFYYCAYVLYDGEYYYGDKKSFKTQKATTGVLNGHEWVDLGLPSGTKWATCNIGAIKPEDYGDYFAWGETETKTTFTRATYKYWSGDRYIYVGMDISGTNKDAAHVQWGSTWQMPTLEQKKELIENCMYIQTYLNDVKGTLLTGPNGSTLFLPYAGRMSISSLKNAGKEGYYRLSTGIDYGYYGYVMHAQCWLYYDSEDNIELNWQEDPYDGLSIRPVTK